MNRRLFPAIAITAVTIILVTINELTETTFIQDYALLLIIGAMFFGLWIARLSQKSKD